MKRPGLHERFCPTLTEQRQIWETERFYKKYIVPADKRKLWALITGWDKVLDKPAEWKDGELT